MKMEIINTKTHDSSFRDPSGFLFWQDEKLYRFISTSYKENFECLLNSGLWEHLLNKKLIVNHIESDIDSIDFENKYKIYKPDILPFISYPYEWNFSALKEAALLTLKIQKISLKYNMSLKDASAYNVQFVGTKPIFIDILSFEKYKENVPWIAYKQFCQHFLSPLLLMSYNEQALQSLLLGNIDGIPLELTTKLLPKRTLFNFSIFTHIHLNAFMQKSLQDKPLKNNGSNNVALSKNSQINLLNDLENLIKNLQIKNNKTVWADYYNAKNINNYNDDSFEHKKQLVKEYLGLTNSKTVVDLGANAGMFSKIAAETKDYVISCDMDYLAVENNYSQLKNENNEKILPLIINLCTPSPSIGWFCKERPSFFERIGNNTVFGLALIHHLRISNNVPVKQLAEFFSKISNDLIIEFVSKEDCMAQKLLSTREDIFDDYSKEIFEKEFSNYFNIIKSSQIGDSQRFLYLMNLRINNKSGCRNC